MCLLAHAQRTQHRHARKIARIHRRVDAMPAEPPEHEREHRPYSLTGVAAAMMCRGDADSEFDRVFGLFRQVHTEIADKLAAGAQANCTLEPARGFRLRWLRRDEVARRR